VRNRPGVRIVPVFPARSLRFGGGTANDRWPSAAATGRTGVNLVEVIHRSSDLFPTVETAVDNCVDNRAGAVAGRARYFH
jgi:hypothetical protein